MRRIGPRGLPSRMPALLEGIVASPRGSRLRAHSRNGDGPAPLDRGDVLAELEELARDGARTVRDLDGAPAESYRCQATEALRATEPLRSYDLRQYIRELTSGNVGLPRLLHVAVRALSGLDPPPAPTPQLPAAAAKRCSRPDSPPAPIPRLQAATAGGCCCSAREELNLRPGDTVEVRSPKEIAPTVDESGKTRGLSFDWEMMPYCGGRYRVQDRVERIIDEQTGQMIEISSDCLILDGVVCSGEHSRGRWFCPRGDLPLLAGSVASPGGGC